MDQSDLPFSDITWNGSCHDGIVLHVQVHACMHVCLHMGACIIYSAEKVLNIIGAMCTTQWFIWINRPVR